MTGKIDTLFDSEILNRARAETIFGEQLYELLLAYQECGKFRKLNGTSLPVGELDAELSELYNQIWHAAFYAAPNAKKKRRAKAEALCN